MKGRGISMNAQEIIGLLNLTPLPEEGGYFFQTYKSPEKIPHYALPQRYQSDMSMGTAIYVLFTEADFSALHRLNTDEIYHFYLGDPVEMLLLHPDGSGEIFLLGLDLESGMRPQKVVRRNVWQG
jgi:predicted cupin superfamily sugar epimerase